MSEGKFTARERSRFAEIEQLRLSAHANIDDLRIFADVLPASANLGAHRAIAKTIERARADVAAYVLREQARKARQ